MDNTAYDNDSVYLRRPGLWRPAAGVHLRKVREQQQCLWEEEVKVPTTDRFLRGIPRRDRDKHGLFYSWEVDNSWLQSLSANAFQQQNDRHFYTYTGNRLYSRDINSYSTLDTDGALVQMDFQPLGNHRLIAGLQYLNDDVDQTRHVDTVSWTPAIAPTGIEQIRDKASIETWAMFYRTSGR